LDYGYDCISDKVGFIFDIYWIYTPTLFKGSRIDFEGL